MQRGDWDGSVRAKNGNLYIRFMLDGVRREKAAGLPDTAKGRAEAEALLESMRKKIKAKDRIVAEAGGRTVRAYAKTWLEGREQNSSVGDDRQRLDDHVLPTIGTMQIADVGAGDIRRLVLALEKKKATRPGPLGENGKPTRVKSDRPLAPRTIRNVYAVISALFRDAVIDGLINASPCVLYGAHLPAARDRDREWRDRAVFEWPEVAMLIRDPRIPWDRRVFYAIMFLGCCRFGEASALRWRHYDVAVKPLPKLRVVESYSTRLKRTKETKAERPRAVPVCPALASALAEWKLGGWREFMKAVDGMDRLPGPDDLIVPSRLGHNRSASHMLKKFHEDLAKLKSEDRPEGLRFRRQHDARRTWLSAVICAGANETHAKWIAHGPPPTVLAHYLTIPWSTMCAVVDRVAVPKLEAHG